MNRKQVEKLRALDARASPGAWEWRDGDTMQHNGLHLTEPDCQVLVAARIALPQLLAEREALIAALREVEWRGEAGHWDAGGCPSCGAEELVNWQHGDHHTTDCKLRAALALAES